MTSDREPTDRETHREIVDGLNLRYRESEIDETAYRKGLARQGFNATEIEQLIKENKPHGV